MIPDQAFHCPCCGAPGQLMSGHAEYSCQCRFMRVFVQAPAPWSYPYPYQPMQEPKP